MPANIDQDHQLPPGHDLPRIESHEQHAVREEHENRGKPPRKLGLILTIIAITLGALLLFGLLRHYRQQKVVEAAAHQEQESIPTVNVTKVRRSPSTTTQMLPGNMTPLMEAYIYARANGYVAKRLADIGDRVQKNQLLAVIEAPDLDQQVAQARAALAQSEHQLAQAKQQLAQTQSQEELARVTWERYKVLLKDGAVARQDADQMQTNYRSAVATTGAAAANVNAAEKNVDANRANLDRNLALQQFEYVRAPFAGVITARNFDVGALVGAGGSASGTSTTPNGGTQSSGAAGTSGSVASGSSPAPSVGATTAGAGGGELFRMAQTHILRILVNVPQESAAFIHVGAAANVFVSEFATFKYTGKVTRTAGAIDLTSRTLLTEVDVANSDQKLLPGMYAQVQIENVRANPPLLVPGDSIIAGANGLQIAVVTDITNQPNENGGPQRHYPADAKEIQMRNVQVGRDYGSVIEVISGLQGNEEVVVNPGDVVQEGAIVKPVAAPQAQTGQGRRAPSEKQPGGLGQESPGMSDSGGRGASEKGGGGGQKGGQSKGGSDKSSGQGK